MHPQPTSLSSEYAVSEIALCRSAIYEALALGFRYPTLEVLQRLATEPSQHSLADLCVVLDNHFAHTRAKSQVTLVSCVACLAKCQDIQSLDNLSVAYGDLFGHSTCSRLSAYETAYEKNDVFRQTQELADISGFVKAFGLRLNFSERVDHASVECEFMCFLARKEAYLLEVQAGSQEANQEKQAGVELLTTTRQAQRLFLQDHLGRFAVPLGKLLQQQCESNSFYGVLGALCERFVSDECSSQQVVPGSGILNFPYPGDEAGCMNCDCER
jgi:TorA maturation chaperone TorD